MPCVLKNITDCFVTVFPFLLRAMLVLGKTNCETWVKTEYSAVEWMLP